MLKWATSRDESVHEVIITVARIGTALELETVSSNRREGVRAKITNKDVIEIAWEPGRSLITAVQHIAGRQTATSDPICHRLAPNSRSYPVGEHAF